MSLSIKTGVSTQPDTVAAVKELVPQIRQYGTKLVVFFSSYSHNGQKVSDVFSESMHGIKAVGCSTNGEITPKGFLSKSITAMSLASPDLEAGVAFAIGMHDQPQQVAGRVLQMAFSDLGERINRFDPKQHVLMVLPDGLSKCEEAFMDAIHQAAPDLAVVGGSAGDELSFKGPWVSGVKQASKDSVAVVLFKTTHPWVAMKTSSFVPTGQTLKITRADPEKRLVSEFDGKPAVHAYADVLGIPAEKIQEAWLEHPLAVKLEDGYYNRSPLSIASDEHLIFACSLAEGATVHIMQAGNMESNLSQAMKDMKQKLNNQVAGFIAFNCRQRFAEAEKKNASTRLFDILSLAPMIGLNTYGSQYNHLHINQTLTMLAFGH